MARPDAQRDIAPEIGQRRPVLPLQGGLQALRITLMLFVQLAENPALLFADGKIDLSYRDPFRRRDAQAFLIDQKADRTALGTYQAVVQRMFLQLDTAHAGQWRSPGLGLGRGDGRRDRSKRAVEAAVRRVIRCFHNRRRRRLREKEIQRQRKLVRVRLILAAK